MAPVVVAPAVVPPAVVAPWAHTQEGDGADPINLTIDDVSAADICSDLGALGWNSPNIADDLFLHAGDQELCQDKQAVQSVLASFKASFTRLMHFHFPHPVLRYHVRIWDLPPNAFLWRDGLAPESYTSCASVHVEPLIGIHDPINFEQGEKFVARQLKRDGYSVWFDEVPLGNSLQTPLNNGFATHVAKWKL